MPQNTSIPFQIKRLYNGSLDADYSFTTAQRLAYLTATNNKYAGQIVYDSDLDKLFKINSTLDAYTPLVSEVTGLVFDHDITVSLGPGKTLGKYNNGDVIPSTGKTAIAVLDMIAVQELYPTYTAPTASTNSTVIPSVLEVGATLNTTLTASFQQNDAGAQTSAQITNGNYTAIHSAPYNYVGTIAPGNLTFATIVSYGAGAIKYSTPSHLAAPGNITAGSVNGSGLNFYGDYKIFYGPVTSFPTDNTTVRALANNQFVSSGNSFTVNTGSALKFAFALPPGKTLTSVVDVDALNSVVTSEYQPGVNITINDLSGSPVTYTLYKKSQDTPYDTNHRHNVIIA